MYHWQAYFSGPQAPRSPRERGTREARNPQSASHFPKAQVETTGVIWRLIVGGLHVLFSEPIPKMTIHIDCVELG